jgi:hypothetical protein
MSSYPEGGALTFWVLFRCATIGIHSVSALPQDGVTGSESVVLTKNTGTAGGVLACAPVMRRQIAEVSRNDVVLLGSVTEAPSLPSANL